MKNKIVLNVYRPDRGVCGVVRLSEEAERRVKQIQRETGLSAKYIVSQIIIQGYDLIEVKRSEGGME